MQSSAREHTPVVHGQNSTSEIQRAPVGFRQNQINVLVLPVVNGSQKHLWVDPGEVSLPQDVRAQLEEVFHRSPYLRHSQAVVLSKCFGLHPDQVKVWFMLNRLRYGVSWDSTDVLGEKMKSFNRVEMLLANKERNNSMKTEGKELVRKNGKEPRLNQRANVRRRADENMCDDERLEGKTKPPQVVREKRSRKLKNLQEENMNTRKREKKIRATDVIGKNLGKKGADAKMASDKVTMESTKSKVTRSARRRKPNIHFAPKSSSQAGTLMVLRGHRSHGKSEFQGKKLIETSMEGQAHASSANPEGDFSATEVIKVTKNIASRHSSCTLKTKHQVDMMRRAFLHCQYPDREGYNTLEALSGVPHHSLVTWFCDTRYLTKKYKPRWMSPTQHRRALDSILRRQYPQVQQDG